MAKKRKKRKSLVPKVKLTPPSGRYGKTSLKFGRFQTLTGKIGGVKNPIILAPSEVREWKANHKGSKSCSSAPRYLLKVMQAWHREETSP